MPRRHSPHPYPQLADFADRLSTLYTSSISSPNDENNSEVLDSRPDEGLQWPPFRPTDFMEFMSLEQATGALLSFSILTVQSLSRPGWIFYRLPWLLN